MVNTLYPTKKVAKDTVEINIRGNKYRLTDTRYKRRRKAKIMNYISNILIAVGIVIMFGLVGRSDMLAEMGVKDNTSLMEYTCTFVAIALGYIVKLLSRYIYSR